MKRIKIGKQEIQVNQGQPTRIYIGSGPLKPSSEYCLTKEVDTVVKTYIFT